MSAKKIRYGLTSAVYRYCISLMVLVAFGNLGSGHAIILK
jgi:hypothetical protein